MTQTDAALIYQNLRRHISVLHKLARQQGLDDLAVAIMFEEVQLSIEEVRQAVFGGKAAQSCVCDQDIALLIDHVYTQIMLLRDILRDVAQPGISAIT